MSVMFINPGGIKKIVNVYLLECQGGEKTPGLGDYLRGSFSLLQLCKLLNLEFAMDLSAHPLSKYLNKALPVEGVDYSRVHYYKEFNLETSWHEAYNAEHNVNINYINGIISWLNNQQGPVVSIFSNSVPFFFKFRPEGIRIIREYIEPNEEMKENINRALTNLKLQPKKFGVIHIRTGDHYLKGEKLLNNRLVLKIKKKLITMTNPKCNYLIISDSNELKRYLINFPNFHMMFKTIEHLGGESVNKENIDGIRNTLLEFYLMSNSNSVLSMSIYDHISGFSQFCCVAHEIPFKYIHLN
jgi:hypothetical protein